MVKSLNAAFTRLFDRPDAGKLALRLTFGGLMLFHGVAKIQHGVGWIADALQQQGLPAFIAYGVYVGEILAPILIVFGAVHPPRRAGLRPHAGGGVSDGGHRQGVYRHRRRRLGH